MSLRRLGIVAAIIATLGFSCHNEPNYPTPGMSNGPEGSGAGTAPATSSVTAPRPESSKGAAQKRP